MPVVITAAMQAAADKAWNDVIRQDPTNQMGGLDAALIAAVEARDREQPTLSLERAKTVYENARNVAEENKYLKRTRPNRFIWFVLGFGLCYLITSAAYGVATYAFQKTEPWDAGVSGLTWPMAVVRLFEMEKWPRDQPASEGSPSETKVPPPLARSRDRQQVSELVQTRNFRSVVLND
jgi:hypothetical protein